MDDRIAAVAQAVGAAMDSGPSARAVLMLKPANITCGAPPLPPVLSMAWPSGQATGGDSTARLSSCTRNSSWKALPLKKYPTRSRKPSDTRICGTSLAFGGNTATAGKGIFTSSGRPWSLSGAIGPGAPKLPQP